MKGLIAFFSLAVLILASCTIEKPLPVEFSVLERGNLGKVDTLVLYPVDEAEYWLPAAMGNATRIHVGEHNNIRAHTLLRFYPYTLFDTTYTINGADLVFTQIASYGIDTGDSLSVTIYPLKTSEWDEDDVLWSDIADQIELTEPLANFKVPFSDSGLVHCSLPPELIVEWINSEDENNGIIISSDNNSFLAGFLAYESYEAASYIDIAYEKDTTIDTVSLTASEEATVAEHFNPDPDNEIHRDKERLILGNMSCYRSLLRFDLSQVPEKSTIHLTTLKLNIDNENSEGYNGLIAAANFITSDSVWDTSTLKVDSLITRPMAAAYIDDGYFKLSSTLYYFSDAWIMGSSTPNYGILLEPYAYGYDPSELHFYTSSTTSDSLKPTLMITYTEPPDPRF